MVHRRHRRSRRGNSGKWKKAAGITACVAALVFLFLATLAPSTFRLLLGMVGISKQADEPASQCKGAKGIDVSHHQGDIDWVAVSHHSGVEFAYVKATEGVKHTDRHYRRNISGARAVGIKVGAYHFFTSRSSATEQFRHFADVAKTQDMDLIPVVDVEESGMGRWNRRQIADSLAVFCRLAKEHYGKAPMIYSSAKFYTDNLSPRFDNHYLFIAAYGSVEPSVPGCNVNIWQYSENGSVKGIGGGVDMDILVGGTRLKQLYLR